MNDKNVFLVEKAKDSLLSVNLLMKLDGYEVTVYENLNEALENIHGEDAESSSCRLLITDLHLSCFLDNSKLPIKRNLMNDKDLPIFVIANSSDRKTREDFEKKGVYILEKPIQSQELLSLVNNIFSE